MTSSTEKPGGDLILRTLAMPADTNPHGDIFGGWIMSQMDIAGGIMAKEIARSRVVTVAVNTINFIKPVHVGDTVGLYGKLIRIGKTSLTINLEVWVRNVLATHPPLKVTEAAFTFVALDKDGKKHPVIREDDNTD
jgi:acyl-CoA thioesterase YciA